MSLTPAKHALLVSLTEKFLSSVVDTGEALKTVKASLTSVVDTREEFLTSVATPAKPKLSNISINILKIKIVSRHVYCDQEGKIDEKPEVKIS